MQQYIQNRCHMLDSKYHLLEGDLKRKKENDCCAITSSFGQLFEANRKKRKIALAISESIAIVIGIMCVIHNSFGIGLLVLIGLCVATYNITNYIFKEKDKELAKSRQAQIEIRENELSKEIQQLNAKKIKEKKQIEVEINHTMNQYRISFEHSKTILYLVEWIINVLSIEITKADRSKWLPQVKTNLRFLVEFDSIEIPGFGKYNMTNQGIHIDNNPMAIGALAYVLEKMTLAEARKRFQVDPNGGRPVFTSNRYDAHVEILYSAPNGGARTMR